MSEIPDILPQTDANGYESHPAFGVIGASRGSSQPGVALFDSDIKHTNTVRIRIGRAVRSRDLHHDWIGGREQLIELELSEAQWASFVSTMNVGDGVPCTVRRVGVDWMPDPPYDPRLAHSMAETHDAAIAAFSKIRDAMEAYEATLKGPAKARNEALRTLRSTIQNAVPNVDYAGKVLVEHAEDVVTKARADIEAFVVGKALQLGMDPAALGGNPLMLGSGE